LSQLVSLTGLTADACGSKQNELRTNEGRRWCRWLSLADPLPYAGVSHRRASGRLPLTFQETSCADELAMFGGGADRTLPSRLRRQWSPRRPIKKETVRWKVSVGVIVGMVGTGLVVLVWLWDLGCYILWIG